MGTVTARVFWSAKWGSPAEEWEDGCAFSETRQRFAVTDGASASFLAGEWAREVAECYARGEATGPLDGWVATVARQHERSVKARLAATSDEVWYVDEAAARGSYCTFLGLEVMPAARGVAWTATAVGDTCLFHLREDRLIQAFPLDRAEDFGSTPDLVTSRAHAGSFGGRNAEELMGIAAEGDVLVLASDAMSQWALEHAGEGSWRLLTGLRAAGLGQLVDELRSVDEMVNDDVTLVRCRVEA